MFTFKDDVVNRLTLEDRFDLITDGYLREPMYDFGTELVIADDPEHMIKYETEYLSDECSLKNARMLWCWSLKSKSFTLLDDDPISADIIDEGYEDEHYLEIKARVAKGDYPDLTELKSPAEFKLVMPKLMEDGIVEFNRETGEYSLREDVQAELEKKFREKNHPIID